LEALDSLQDELKRYRETAMPKIYDVDVVENFFLFFHTIKSLGEQLCEMDQRLHDLYED